MLRSIIYSASPHPSLQILNQLTLPHQELYLPIATATAAWQAIARMQVRGAPAIALVAALALAVELHAAYLSDAGDSSLPTTEPPTEKDAETDPHRHPERDAETDTAATALATIIRKLDYLVTARPTAVNLADAARKLEAGVRVAAGREGATARTVYAAYVRAAGEMLAEDVRVNERIGDEGARWIVEWERERRVREWRTRRGEKGEEAEKEEDGRQNGKKEEEEHDDHGEIKISVLTHCNTGSLATAGYGTALGVIRSLHAANHLAHVYYTETRPYHQGSRLTGLELLRAGIPATLVTDSAAAALLAGAHSSATHPRPCAVVVGADRVARNGDTANKVGTYALAVLARWHGAAFLVAAPRTTIDVRTADGSGVVVEERAAREMVTVRGPVVRTEKRDGAGGDDVPVDVERVVEVSVAPTGTQVWNPAFDVTPAALIDGIVTEVGVAEKTGDAFDLEAMMEL